MTQHATTDEPQDHAPARAPQQPPPAGPREPIQGGLSAEEVQQREQQRAALRDLVVLATETATTEADLERQFHATNKEADDEFRKASREVAEQYAAAKEQVEQGYAQRLESAKARAHEELSAVHSADRDARQRIRNETEPMERDIKQKFDHAIWMAESVFEVAAHTAKEEFKKAKEGINAQVETLNGLEQRSWLLFQRFGIVLPPDDEQYVDEVGPDPKADHESRMEIIDRHALAVRRMRLPLPFFGANLWLFIAMVAVVVAIAAQVVIVGSLLPPNWIVLGVGAVLAGAMVFGIVSLLRSKVRSHLMPIRRALSTAIRASRAQLKSAEQEEERKHAAAVEARRAEVLKARERFKPIMAEAKRRRDTAVGTVQSEFQERMSGAEQFRTTSLDDVEQWHRDAVAETEQQHQENVANATARRDQRKHDAYHRFTDGRTSLAARLKNGLHTIRGPIEQQAKNEQRVIPWDDPAWANWQPPRTFTTNVRIGEMQVDLRKIAEQAANGAKLQLELPPPFTVPVTLGFPRQASLLVQSDREGRGDAIRGLQMTMARLLTQLPAGRVRFTIIDPVGLGQNFAGFMHLADHDEALVGGRIWTEAEHIEQRLTNLTEHMETVIQKYLRNEYDTIDEYNAQAGELAEPYRFLVIADFPHGFQGNAYRRLASIAQTGARCGVYTLISRDVRQSLPADANLEELEAAAVNLVRQSDRFVWKDAVFSRFPLTLDPPPGEEFLTRILDVVGRRAKEANRVEVPFESIAPKPDQLWSRSTIDDLVVPIGRLGATRLQHLRFGRGVAQHGLIAGKTGSGKSTLLHAIVTNLAMWYSPDEVEVYLIDFKKGVEFKTYATHQLPHARAIAVESDREFGLSVLQRLDAELARRGEIFRRSGVQDLGSYRKAPSPQRMPRTLLVIDEFQEFFSEDDKLAQEAGLLLDRLVRQGRAFGIHLLLGSQTIGGTSGLARSTIGQMAVRIALQTSEADSHLILGDSNSAARLLSRPGEAIYNDQGGLVEGNSPFQVAWLPDEQREVFLTRVQALDKQSGNGREAPVVFEGNAAADVRHNQRLGRLIEAPKWPAIPNAPVMYLGDPVAIKEPTSVTLRRQAGANVLIVGQQEEAALATMVAGVLSLSAQHPNDGCRFYVLDGSAADSPLATVLPFLKTVIPQDVRLVEYRAVEAVMNELAAEQKTRQSGETAADPSQLPAVYVFIYGLQRYRVLRKSEDSFGGFSMSASDEPKATPADKSFAELLKEGPTHGIHVIAWCDTAVSLDRTLDRQSMREFDNRVLFQMSANDSSNLIDSPAANKLGFHRALAYSEEQGVMEKFRPYGLPEKAWLQQVQQRMGGKQ